MAASESLTLVRSRIGKRIAEIERRATRGKPVDMGARMAAIRRLAATRGPLAP